MYLLVKLDLPDWIPCLTSTWSTPPPTQPPVVSWSRPDFTLNTRLLKYTLGVAVDFSLSIFISFISLLKNQIFSNTGAHLLYSPGGCHIKTGQGLVQSWFAAPDLTHSSCSSSHTWTSCFQSLWPSCPLLSEDQSPSLSCRPEHWRSAPQWSLWNL